MNRLKWSWKHERKLLVWLAVGSVAFLVAWAFIGSIWVAAGMLPHMAVINICLIVWGLSQLASIYFKTSEYDIMRYLK